MSLAPGTLEMVGAGAGVARPGPGDREDYYRDELRCVPLTHSPVDNSLVYEAQSHQIPPYRVAVIQTGITA